MKYLMSLFILLSATQALSQEETKLIRLVCQYYDRVDEKFSDYVAILDQLSVDTDPKTNFGFKTADGRILIDLNHRRFFTGEVEFRMRIYRASLISSKKTEEEIIGELDKRQADKDTKGRLMDYTGLGSRLYSEFTFGSTGPYAFEKIIRIQKLKNPTTTALKDPVLFSGLMKTYNSNGSGPFFEDGIYRCKNPVLVSPEST